MRLLLLSCLYWCLSPCAGLTQESLFPGKIINPEDSVVVLRFAPQYLGDTIRIDSFRLTDQHTFQFNYIISKPTLAELSHGQLTLPVFLHPQHSLSLQLHFKEPGKAAISFNGSGAADNSFYLAYQLRQKSLLAQEVNKEDLSTDPQRYATYIQRLANANYRFTQEYPLETGKEITEDLQRWMERDIVYTSVYLLLNYPDKTEADYDLLLAPSLAFELLNPGDPRFIRWPYLSDEGDPSLQALLKRIPLNDEAAIGQPVYQKFLESYFYDYLQYHPSNEGKYQSFTSQYNLLDRYFTGKAKYFLQSLILKYGIANNPDEVAQIYGQFIDSKAPLPLRRSLYSLYYEATRTVRGREFPASAFRQMDGRPLARHFFENKISYIYFVEPDADGQEWEWPYFRRIARKYGRNSLVNIVMVLSFETGDKKFEKMAEQGAAILHLDQEAHPDFMDQFLIRQLPEFFLIDPFGRILSDTSFSPSSGQVPALLRQLLKDYWP